VYPGRVVFVVVVSFILLLVLVAFPNVGQAAGPETVYGTTAGPDAGSSDSDVTVGVDFTVTAAGQIGSVRYWQPTTGATTDPRRVGVWNAAGQLLGSSGLLAPSGSGWQDVPLSSPVDVAPGTQYTAGVSFPTGGYPATPGAFGAGHAQLASDHVVFNLDGVGGVPNGVFHYQAGLTRPVDSFGSASYWVDVSFTLAVDPTPSPSPSASSTPGPSPSPSPSSSTTAPAPGATFPDQPPGTHSVSLAAIAGPAVTVLELGFAAVCMCLLCLVVLVVRSFKAA